MQTKFTKNIDECVCLFNTQKVCLTTYLKKNFKEGVHFIETKQTEKLHQRGGHNRIDMLLTVETFK